MQACEDCAVDNPAQIVRMVMVRNRFIATYLYPAVGRKEQRIGFCLIRVIVTA